MKRIETQDGRFAAGNPQNGTPGTMVSSLYMNNLQDEVCNVITESGLELDDADTKQVFKAINKIIAASSMLVVPTTPTEQLPSGLIFVEDRLSLHTWVNTAYYTGYRSLKCGKFEWGDTPLPRPYEIEAEGDIIAGADYPSLVAHFKETGQIKPIADWIVGEYFLGDMGGGMYRLPDMRDQFIRATGTNRDTANARLLATKQAPSIETHHHGVSGGSIAVQSGSSATVVTASISGNSGDYGGSETRPANVALNPRIRL